MDRYNRVQEIDEAIAALKREKAFLQFYESVFSGENYTQLCAFVYQDNERRANHAEILNTAMSKLVRFVTGVKSLSQYRIEPDRGERLQKMIEAISRAILDSDYWDMYDREHQ